MAIFKVCSPLHPDFTISLALFDDVTNSNHLKQQVMDGQTNVALIKSSMILDTFQIITASTRAIHLNRYNKMTTKTLHSEILYSLSASKNISDAFRKFGIGKEDTSVLVVEISKGESRIDDIVNKVHGTLLNIEQISSMADVDLIKKTYKVKDAEFEVGTLLEAIVGRMACKDFL